MAISQILGEAGHRPWPIPDKKWMYYQEWNRAVFLHWKVASEHLRPLVPSELELDAWDGTAWVSVVAFTMERIRPRFLPSFPPISDFDEINIRTYVRFQEKQGVYFLSIEGGKKISCMVARELSGLPYYYSNMFRDEHRFQAENAENESQFHLSYGIGDKITTPTPADLWLTERYALFQEQEEDINAFEIHHQAWPLYEVRISDLALNYPKFAHLFSGAPDLVHYSPGIPVLAWGRERFPRS